MFALCRGTALALALALTAGAARAVEPAPADEVALYVEIGREALARGAAEEARVAFEAARALAPASPRVAALLGRALAEQGRTAEAVQWLTAALAGGDEAPETRRTLGVALYTLRRDAEAEAALAPLVARDPGDARAAYYLGLARHRQGDHRGALSALRPVADGGGPYATPAAFIAGTSALQLGAFDRALADFEAARAAPSAELAARADEMIALTARRARRWDLVLLAGAEYDSNVLQAPTAPGALPLAAPRSDVAALLIAVAGWRPPGLDALRAQYTVFDRHLVETAEQRLFGQSLGATWSPQVGRWRPIAGYAAHHFLLGGDHYLLAHDLRGAWGWSHDRWLFEGGYAMRFEAFAAPFDAFDGTRHGPELRARWRPAPLDLAPLDLTLTYGALWHTTRGTGRVEGSEYDHLRHRAALDAGVAVGGGVTLSVGFVGERADYAEVGPLPTADGRAVPRADRRWEASATVAWQIGARWLVRAHGRWVDNDANVPVYAFDKALARLSVGHVF